MKKSVHIVRLLPIFPLIVGVIGFVALDGAPFLDAVFKCLTMYVMNYSDTPPNMLVEIARWTAPLATAGGVVAAVSSLQKRVVSVWKYIRGGSVAVYGPEEEKELILGQLGRHGINGHDRLLKAERYILLGGESDSFAFYRSNEEKLRSRPVYIKCASLPAQSVSEPNLKLFCPEETAARLYWRQRDVYALWKKCPGTMKIVCIGFGKLGEELLLKGLQNNLFAPKQRLEYHIFGDCAAFLATHTGLGEISDPVIQHNEPWYDSVELIEQAGLVIVLGQEEQLSLFQKLLSTTLRSEIDVFSAEEPALALLAQRERLRIFHWKEEAMSLKLLFEDTMYLRAKHINLRYCHLYQGISETAENMEKEWNRLDAFTRYSNVSAADYHEQRLLLLKAQGLSDNPDDFPPETMEQLAELEHIRWCRYHYLNNWRYGQPENGKAKDCARRIHSLLCPYAELSKVEKEKDRENIRVLLSIK